MISQINAVVSEPHPIRISTQHTADPADFGKVVVLYGGLSAERDVSLQSGEAVLRGLLEGGVDAHPLDVDENVFDALKTGGFDRAFNILHGRGGEDGAMQGALELLGLPSTGSGVLGSALAMDKQRTKLIWQSIGLPVAASQIVKDEADLQRAGAELGFPIMVKPVHEGSSIGMGKAHNGESLLSAWWKASQYDDEIMVERWIDGQEYTIGLVGREVLPAIKLMTPRSFYDYEAKYADGSGTKYICPCGLKSTQEAQLGEMARRAFNAVGASGWGRVDLIVDENGPWLLEVNTNPGMTSHSLVPMAAEHRGLTFAQLVWRILETTL